MSVGKSDLDMPQIIQNIYDDTANAIQVAVVSGSGGNDVNIHDSAGNDLTSTGGSLNVNLTGGTLTVSNESNTFDGEGNPISSVSGSLNTNVTASVLPTGASTSANQTTANTTLSTIATNTGNIPTVGQKTSADSTPVVIASDQSAIPVTVTFPTEQNVNINEVSGATPSATNSLAVQLSNGTAYYDATNIRALTTTDVVSVQGGNTTAVKVDGSAVVQPVSQSTFPWTVSDTANISASGGASSPVATQIAGQYNATPPTLTDGQSAGLQTDSNSRLIVAPLTSSSTVSVVQATGSNLHTTVDSSALPTGASTSANQTTANTSLATIATNTAPLLVPSAFYSGQKTSSGTAVAISTSQAIQNGVIVQALSGNAASVYVGATGVTSSTGFELQPGQATSIGVNNLSSVFVISTTSGDGICFIGS